MRSALKRFIPDSVKLPIRNWVTRRQRRQRRYAPLTLAETFDRIYNTNAWGGGDPINP